MPSSIKLSDMLEKVREDSEGDSIQVADVLDILESRGYGPVLLAISLMTILPTGAIPGVPTLTAILVLLIAPQMLFGMSHPWVPNFIKKKSIAKSKFEKAEQKSLELTKRIDSFVRPRWKPMLHPIGVKLIGLCMCVLALTLPPLELVPFAAFVPALAIAFFALGLSAKDGVLVFIGYIFAGSALGFTLMKTLG